MNGFLRRELLKHRYGEYADLVHWRDQAAAEAIMATVGTSSECIAYLALMDMDGVDPAEGVRHCASLAAYSAT
ncbi:hypothetical protein BMJ34_28405 [Sinorhizobium medicae]|uniref:Uncharacterized protein n=1 Tax=Sinorhizobium medicae TaxID=110321 RepID=A0ABX4TLY4_9HYPH|nr:hypothetical protein BMJ34_28405 [Sinorhizobium medicae]PLU02532.1 hypothetical protein BMJ33_16380 [Sinorhizobium medicae]PLU13227.1 hypothetical protein BMJ30_25805 [Sinorhizobium medicae]PLU18516.1 hypothetical protein BMJ29_18155 [Sinorhizobium medicae]PLU33561.1 hypothetical protein BMJ27_16405 [Sinorhizobium medicae]